MTTNALRGRTALVTGVSRRAGIGHAIACRLAGLGANLFLQGYRTHDFEQAWGADPEGEAGIVASVRNARSDPHSVVRYAEFDLARPDASGELLAAAGDALGHIDILICNHAKSGDDGSLDEVTATMLDTHWAVNTRSTLLLAQAFCAQHDGRAGGRIVFLTSGQDLGPMCGEIAYAASKGALASITRTIADHCADRMITVNAVNPGPIDTGYATGEDHELIRQHFPSGRWGQPDDPARLICWLVTDDAAWITGQVLASEGGFRR